MVGAEVSFNSKNEGMDKTSANGSRINFYGIPCRLTRVKYKIDFWWHNVHLKRFEKS